jgi:hypothetical protein
MKNTKRLIQIVLGGILALRACPASKAEIMILGSTDTFNVNAVQGGHVEAKGMLTWGFGSSAGSPVDGSSASGGMSVSGAVGLGAVFTGSGGASLEAGTFRFPGQPDEPSVSVAIVESVFVLFQITGSSGYNYNLATHVETKGNIVGSFHFPGILDNSVGGTLTASGYMPPGQYQFSATMADGASQTTGGSGTWSYSLSLTPVPPPAEFSNSYSDLQKSQFYEKGLMYQEYAADARAPNVGIPDSVIDVILSSARNFDEEAAGYLELARDPLDTNYTVLAEAVVSPVIPLSSGSGITQPEANAFNSWSTNLAQSAGLSTALMASVDRAQGAAYAGDSSWQMAQRNAAVQFEAQLATLLDQEPSLRSNVVAQFESGGFQSVTNTVNDAINFQNEIATNGLPQWLLQGLMDIGTDSTTITNIQNDLLAADPSSLAGSFPAILVNTNLDSASVGLAAVLRAHSLVLISPGLLPSGQFRFDLPTEPGYTYSIEHTDNVASPSSWTTILITNAATSLLSFTNTAAVNAPVGYYRASLAPSQ